MMMKKMLVFLLTMGMLLAMVACTSPSALCSQTAAPAATPLQRKRRPLRKRPRKTATMTIGVSLYARDQFISNLEQAILKAAEGSGYTVDSQEANNDTQKQQEQVRTFALKGYDAMIVNLVDTSTAETILAEAGDTPGYIHQPPSLRRSARSQQVCVRWITGI